MGFEIEHKNFTKSDYDFLVRKVSEHKIPGSFAPEFDTIMVMTETFKLNRSTKK